MNFKKGPRVLAVGKYSTYEVSRETGATARMLQWWDEQHLFQPHHNGHTREWSERDLNEVRLVMDLRKKSLSLQRVRQVVEVYRRIRQDFPVKRFYLCVEVPFVNSQNWNWRNVKMATSEEGAFALLLDSTRPMIVSEVRNEKAQAKA